MTRLYWPFSPLAAEGHGGEGGSLLGRDFGRGRKKNHFPSLPLSQLDHSHHYFRFMKGAREEGEILLLRLYYILLLLFPTFLTSKNSFSLAPFGGRTLTSRKKCPLGSFLKPGVVVFFFRLDVSNLAFHPYVTVQKHSLLDRRRSKKKGERRGCEEEKIPPPTKLHVHI